MKKGLLIVASVVSGVITAQFLITIFHGIYYLTTQDYNSANGKKVMILMIAPVFISFTFGVITYLAIKKIVKIWK